MLWRQKVRINYFQSKGRYEYEHTKVLDLDVIWQELISKKCMPDIDYMCIYHVYL